MNNIELKKRISSFPEKPGVYQFHDSNGKIIYIGKAKNLKKRVQSYFSKTQQNSKTKILLDKTRSINYTVVETESEALLLENIFIKKNQPKYNILLKDDKTYPWINIKKEPFPRVVLTRKYFNNGGLYFGPFSSVVLAKTMLDLIKKLYPLRTCKHSLTQKNISQNKFRPCLEMHLGNCKAPCIANQSREEYDENIDAIKSILSGNISDVLFWLNDRMKNAADKLDYELAGVFKNKIEILEKYRSKTIITGNKVTDTEVYNFLEKKSSIIVNMIKVVKGTIVQTYTINVDKNIVENVNDVLSTIIIEIRQRVNSTAKSIILPIDIEFKLDNVSYTVPKRGEKKELLELSYKNCVIYAQELNHREVVMNSSKDDVLKLLENELGLSTMPYHIECFDNSNLQGTNPVSSCVVFKQGIPSKKDYRHYNVRTVQGSNDFATMQEVVFRRYKRLVEEKKDLPQLILIDGGRGQINAAQESINALRLDNKLQICGIAKRKEEIYLPQKNQTLILDKRSKALRLLQRMRDEAHRFGLKHHQLKRKTSQTQSFFDEIKGIGKETKQKLFNHFKSTNSILNASEKELITIIGKDKTERLLNSIKSKTN